jgi:predicted component of type VI protein secretion system
MAGVTIKILHGADRGKVFENLEPPLTIGREEGNDIQLNDERVSRCHFKIQRDNDRLVLTDLDSTNGTKVNGIETQLKILRYGDLVNVGRSLMLIGTEEQIAARLAMMNREGATQNREVASSESSIAIELRNEPKSPPPNEVMQFPEVPSIPDDLTPGQKAQLCEILDYLQSRLNRLIESARIEESSQEVVLSLAAWQRMLETQIRLATMSRQIADPDWPK